LFAMFTLLSLAGHTTSRNLIGIAVLTLLQHPEQWRLLQRQPELLTSAVEECLRYDTTGQVAGRTALTDVELNGVNIQKGERVYMLLGAANRDPERFPDPERFDITRSPNPHLAFGQGIHYCLGAHLARITAHRALGTLLRRAPQLALRDDSITWAQDEPLRGLKALPVVF